MARRKAKEPGHRRSSEFVREVVAAVVPEQDRERYMPFARELYATLRLGRKQGTVPRSGNVGLAAVQSPFSARNKRVVMKWFRRGLHGNLLWRIGERLLAKLYPATGFGKGTN